MLNMDINTIKNSISLKEAYWENNFETNCYAFALGLDIPEKDIVSNAYTLGVMASNTFNISLKEISKMTFEERFILDLKALKIAVTETDPTDKSYYKYTGNYVGYYWIVSLLCNDANFHFLRKNYDGDWYHKIGFLGPPIKTDSNKNTIESPRDCSIADYKYVKTYKLHYCKRSESLFD